MKSIGKTLWSALTKTASAAAAVTNLFVPPVAPQSPPSSPDLKPASVQSLRTDKGYKDSFGEEDENPEKVRRDIHLNEYGIIPEPMLLDDEVPQEIVTQELN